MQDLRCAAATVSDDLCADDYPSCMVVIIICMLSIAAPDALAITLIISL